jgi:hypothetical protein
MLADCYSMLDTVIKGGFCQRKSFFARTTQSQSLYAYQVKDEMVNLYDEPECEAMILGSLVSQLIKADLYPVRKTEADVTMSVCELQKVFGSFYVRTFDSHHYPSLLRYGGTVGRSYGGYGPDPLEKDPVELWNHGVISHINCKKVVDMDQCASRAVSAMWSPVLTSHMRHMQEQAKK